MWSSSPRNTAILKRKSLRYFQFGDVKPGRGFSRGGQVGRAVGQLFATPEFKELPFSIFAQVDSELPPYFEMI